MAVFTIAKERKEINDNNKNNYVKYVEQQDLIRLVHYCCDKSPYVSWKNLYPFGIDGFIDQMLYLQNFRGKPLSTRAIHYILSINYDELPKENRFHSVKVLTDYVNLFFFDEFQSICCLHNDKKDRFDIHIIINPVNIKNGNLYRCNKKDFRTLLNNLAILLFVFFKLELENVTYIDYETGRLKYDYDMIYARPDIQINNISV